MYGGYGCSCSSARPESGTGRVEVGDKEEDEEDEGAVKTPDEEKEEE